MSPVSNRFKNYGGSFEVLVCILVFFTFFVVGEATALEPLNTGDMRNVSGRAGLDIRFDLRLNADEYGNLEGSASEFRWSDPDGAPNVSLTDGGHLILEKVFGQVETGMDDSVEHGQVDIASLTDSLGNSENVLQISATENDPNSANTAMNEDSNNDGIFDSSEVTFENVELFVTDSKIKYYETGCCGDTLGQIEIDGDFGFDGTKLRVWGN